MNTVGVDGLRGGLSVGLRWKGTKSVDPDRGSYAGHGCCRDAGGCAGACKWIQSFSETRRCTSHAAHSKKIEVQEKWSIFFPLKK